MSEFDEYFDEGYRDLQEGMGDTVTYRPPSPAAPFSVVGILSAPDQLEETFPGCSARLEVSLADFGSRRPAKGDRVTVGASTYTVYEVQADGAVVAILVLQL